MNLNCFIKRHKIAGGIFDADVHRADAFDREFHDHTEALCLLEIYAKSFDRDIPDFIAVEIRKMQVCAL